MISRKISKLLMRRSRKYTAFVVLILAMSMFMLSSLICSMQSKTLAYRSTKELQRKDCLIVCTGGLHPNVTETFMDNMHGVKSVTGSGAKPKLPLSNGKWINLCDISPFMVENVDMPMLSGKWFDEATINDNETALIATKNSGYKVGDCFDADIIIKEHGVDKTESKTFVVIGLLPDNTLYPQTGSVSTPYSMDILFDEYKAKEERDPLLLVSTGAYSIGGPVHIVEFLPDATEEERQLTQEFLLSYGRVWTAKELGEVSKGLVTDVYKSYLPLLIFFSFLAAASMLMISLIIFEKSKRIVLSSIMVGANTRQISLAYLYYYLSAIISAIAVYALLTVAVANPLTYNGMMTKNVGVSVAVAAGYLVLFGGTAALGSTGLARKSYINQ